MIYDVVVLTERRYVGPEAKNSYEANILTEDHLVLNALLHRGLKAIRLSWDDPNFDWAQAKSLLFRTTWDYFHRFQDFQQWLEKVSVSCQLFNPKELIYWNMDKHYLLDLQAKDVAVCPTYFIEKGDTKALAKHVLHSNWNKLVLKPCVSGAGRHTYAFDAKESQQLQTVFSQLIGQESMMLQPFQERIVRDGEISIILFGGEFSHAVLKKAKQGDFRVQDDFGGSVHTFEPDHKALDAARKAYEACHPKPIYARVDMFQDESDQWLLAELELIEPELWFRRQPQAAHLLAHKIESLLQQ